MIKRLLWKFYGHKKVLNILNEMIFEFNDMITRASIENDIISDPILNYISDKIELDEINTSEVINANELRLRILYKEIFSDKWTTIDYVVSRTGVNFNEI